LTTATAFAAQEPAPRLGSAIAEAEVRPGAPLLVTIDYFLHPQGAESVSFSALELGGSRAVNVRAFHGERELSFRTESAPGDRRAGRLDGHVNLPQELGDRERIKLRLRYEVLPRPQAAIGHEAPLVLPMLVAGWPPEETLPTTFVATIRLPRSLRVLDSFPSEYEVLDSPDPARATEAARALDLAAALVLAGLTLYGWRRVRSHLR
jgi:hypothetical protein